MPKLSNHGICIIQLSYTHAQKAFLLFSVDPENVLIGIQEMSSLKFTADLHFSDWLR